jgi:hypothetical protein
MDQRHQQIIIGVFETNVDDYMLSQKLDQPKVQNFVGIRHRGNHEEVFHIKTLRIFGAKCDINVKTVEHLEDTSYRIYIEGIYPMPGDVLSSTSEQTTHVSLLFTVSCFFFKKYYLILTFVFQYSNHYSKFSILLGMSFKACSFEGKRASVRMRFKGGDAT